MERTLIDGDYVPDGAGGLKENDGAEEVLARVLFRLTARRGAMPFLPGLGSRLHEVIREKPGARQTLCAPGFSRITSCRRLPSPGRKGMAPRRAVRRNSTRASTSSAPSAVSRPPAPSGT